MAGDAEDGGYQMLNDEIVTSVQKESDPVDDETDEDEGNNNNNESSKGPSNADAFSALETTMEWYEEQSECCPTQLLLLKKIRYLAAKKGKCTMIQRKKVIIFYNKDIFSEKQEISYYISTGKSSENENIVLASHYKASRGHLETDLVIMSFCQVTNWHLSPAYLEFEPDTAEDSPYKRGRSSLGFLKYFFCRKLSRCLRKRDNPKLPLKLADCRTVSTFRHTSQFDRQMDRFDCKEVQKMLQNFYVFDSHLMDSIHLTS
ncbi:uncharacterized protein TNCV_2558831 [Trichonephila clavipes]|nr:uncharacterized protein TNCV_2558831 [Trichonephila clavipes]